MRTRTFVSMTTLSSRIDRIRPTIESLLGGSHVPDKVLIALPSFSQREQRDYVVPAFLDEFGPSVEVMRCSQDWGPGTNCSAAWMLSRRKAISSSRTTT